LDRLEGVEGGWSNFEGIKRRGQGQKIKEQYEEQVQEKERRRQRANGGSDW